MNEPHPVAEPVRVDFAGRAAAAEYIAVVFEKHEARIHGLVLAAIRDPETAADVTQEAFLRLLGEVQAGRYPDNPAGWLYRAAMNLSVSRTRRVAVARRFAPRLVRRDEPAGPEGIVLERERSKAMADALAKLAPTDRLALIMAAQGLTGEEIAEHLGKNHGATRTLLFRARQRLRMNLEREVER